MCALEWSSRCRNVESSAVRRSGLAIARLSRLPGRASTSGDFGRSRVRRRYPCVSPITDNLRKERLSYEQLSDPAELPPWMEANGGPTATSREGGVDGANRPLLRP